MRTLFVMLASLLLITAFIGCGAQEEPADTGAAGHPEEVADSTRMDSAMNEMEETMDSAATEMQEAAEEAMDEAGEKMDEAVEEATGH